MVVRVLLGHGCSEWLLGSFFGVLNVSFLKFIFLFEFKMYLFSIFNILINIFIFNLFTLSLFSFTVLFLQFVFFLIF